MTCIVVCVTAGAGFRAAFVTNFYSITCGAKRSTGGAFAVTRFGAYESLSTHDELKFFSAKRVWTV